MPVVVSFDISGAESVEHNRIQSFFERFGWENLGGSSYRYPRLGTDDQPTEDWFNHVIPALMLFRAFILKSGRQLTKFTLDTQTSTGYSQATLFGRPPLSPSTSDILYRPNNESFGEKNLKDWIDGVTFPY